MTNRQIEIPVNNNPVVTSRSLKKNHPDNQNLYEVTQEFQDLLREVKIRFDTNPRFYQREDFAKMISVFGDGFIYLYNKIAPEIVTAWNEELSDEKIPSEKLTKNTIDTKQNILTAGSGIDITDDTVSNTLKIPEDVSAFNNDVGYLTEHQDISDKADKVPVIDKSSDLSTSFSIDPNKMYMFGTRASLTIALNSGEANILNEYMFQFTSGSTATTLNVPSSVIWLKDPDIQANKKYAVSIENNLGIIGEWSNE